MDWIRIVLARCTALFGKQKLDADLDEELRSHIDLAMEAVGLIASAGLARFLSSLLYDVRPLDPGAIFGAALVIAICAAAAGLIPARRAASIDPMRALRTE
jgi:ABC-type lipoprotein release transport system permease subunit